MFRETIRNLHFKKHLRRIVCIFLKKTKPNQTTMIIFFTHLVFASFPNAPCEVDGNDYHHFEHKKETQSLAMIFSRPHCAPTSCPFV